ncbi:MAG: homoserine O-acetyltransferase family protein [Bacteroidota bacterium]
MKAHIFHHPEPFRLEAGGVLSSLDLAYHTYGKLNPKADNVIWICHALTGSSEVAEWWPGMIGEGLVFDPAKHFIVCANIPGSCYGSTGPASTNPETGRPYYLSFPELTIRDVVRSLDLLRNHLGIRKIDTIIGASIGAQQALEYSIMFPELIRNLVFIASAVKATPWSVAFNQSQRLAIEADQTFWEERPYAGQKGLKAARSIAMLSYRNDTIYNERQEERDQSRIGHFPASSYQDYQGDKLVRRFDAYSYHALTRLMDSHNIVRERRTLGEAVSRIKARILSVGIRSDLLFPVYEQKLLAHLTGGRFAEIESLYGHDGFLTETVQISALIQEHWREGQVARPAGRPEQFSISHKLVQSA